MARAVREAAAAQAVTPTPCASVEVVAGRGIRGLPTGEPSAQPLFLGSALWMAELGIDLSELQTAIARLKAWLQP